MKGLARENTHVKYESSTTNQSKVMTKVKVFKMKVKLQDQRVKVMVSNERSCQKECTCEIRKPYQSKVMTKLNVFEKVKL
jgi:hypothetical protein